MAEPVPHHTFGYKTGRSPLKTYERSRARQLALRPWFWLGAALQESKQRPINRVIRAQGRVRWQSGSLRKRLLESHKYFSKTASLKSLSLSGRRRSSKPMITEVWLSSANIMATWRLVSSSEPISRLRWLRGLGKIQAVVAGNIVGNAIALQALAARPKVTLVPALSTSPPRTSTVALALSWPPLPSIENGGRASRLERYPRH